jgi:hypothetical protein
MHVALMVMQCARFSQAMPIWESSYDPPLSWYHPVKMMDIRSQMLRWEYAYLCHHITCRSLHQLLLAVSQLVRFPPRSLFLRAAPTWAVLFLPMPTIISKC